jgi:hypothetical protein
MNDDDITEEDKIEIKKHISELKIQLKALQKQADNENIRYCVVLFL